MSEIRKLFENGGNNWKCKLCEKYLTVFPIYYNPTQNYICGRCVQKNHNCDSKEEMLGRQTLFENVANLLIFPCSYDVFGCRAELEMNEVATHEDICPFRNTVCPLNEMNQLFLSLGEVCSWRGDNQNLIPHIRSFHQKYFYKKLEFNLIDTKTFFCFIEECNQVFMVIFKYLNDEQKYIVPVYSNLGEIECNFFRYQLEIWINSEFSVVFRRNRVESLHDQIFKNTSVKFDLKIDAKYLRELLDSDKFRIKLSITKKNKKMLKSLGTNLQLEAAFTVPTKGDSTGDVTLNDKLLRQIECIVCNDYMIPPIFLCIAGHSVCDYCTKLVHSCPACRREMTSTRNYHLEQLAESLDFPCRNKTLGCSFVASFENFKMHEMNCEYSKKPCILKCPWKGDNIQMIIHLQQNHELFNPYDIIALKMTPQRKKLSKAVVHNNHIFQFRILWSSSLPLVFSVCSLSHQFKHKYQIHLIDLSDNKLDVIVNYLCPMLVLNTDRKYVKDDSKDESKLPFEMIKHLIDKNNEITLKLTIFEVNS